jgi:type VI secretion system secreted protein Hcp
MPTPAYLTIKGSQQGLISAGALGPESAGTAWQHGREDQIMVQAVNHDIFVEGGKASHRTHRPLVITKAFDKSSPLLNHALCRAEALVLCRLEFYRISAQGTQERYYTIELKEAVISRIQLEMPNCLNPLNAQLTVMERIYISYRDINWAHEIGKTFGYDSWQGA